MSSHPSIPPSDLENPSIYKGQVASLILGEFLHALQQKTLHLKLHISVLRKSKSGAFFASRRWIYRIPWIPHRPGSFQVLKNKDFLPMFFSPGKLPPLFSQNNGLVENRPKWQGTKCWRYTHGFHWTMIVGGKITSFVSSYSNKKHLNFSQGSWLTFWEW